MGLLNEIKEKNQKKIKRHKRNNFFFYLIEEVSPPFCEKFVNTYIVQRQFYYTLYGIQNSFLLIE